MQKQISGSELRAQRRKKGIRQEDLANKLGISQSCLSLYEKEKQKIPDPLLRKLCAELGIQTSEMLQAENPEEQAFEENTETTETAEAWLESYLDMHKEVLISQLIRNIRKIRKYTFQELIAFERNIEDYGIETEKEKENPLRIFHKLSLMFPCELCKKEHGVCMCSLMEDVERIKTDGEICNGLLMEFLRKEYAGGENHE